MSTGLDRLRGDAPPRNLDARAVAALAANPGCARRGLMDAAGVDKQGVARSLGFEPAYGQSQFAITRENAFAAQVKADDCAKLRELLRTGLGLAVPEAAAYLDLAPTGGETRERRHLRTRAAIGRMLDDDTGLLVDHPLLRLEIGGTTSYLEPDVLAARFAGRFHVIEIKSFAVIDGQADPRQVAAAAREAAVYVLALRRLVSELGHGTGIVAHDVILVCPEGFANRPTAVYVDVRKQLAVQERQLARMARVEELLAGLPAELSFAPGSGLDAAVRSVGARYAPDCMAACDMALFCRHEARSHGSTEMFGRSVRDELGGLDRIETVLGLADGTRAPEPGQEEIAERLRTAARLRHEALTTRAMTV
jgi:hypothetical protein